MKHLLSTLKRFTPAAMLAAFVLLVACHKQIDTTYSVSMNCDYLVPQSTQAVMDSLEIGIATTEVKNTCVKEGINESQISHASVHQIQLTIDQNSTQSFDVFTDMEFFLGDLNGRIIKKIGEEKGISNNSKNLYVDISLENISSLITEDKVKVIWVAKTNKAISNSFVVHAKLDIVFSAVIYN
jgi:hypothetical protein